MELGSQPFITSGKKEDENHFDEEGHFSPRNFISCFKKRRKVRSLAAPTIRR